MLASSASIHILLFTAPLHVSPNLVTLFIVTPHFSTHLDVMLRICPLFLSASFTFPQPEEQHTATCNTSSKLSLFSRPPCYYQLHHQVTAVKPLEDACITFQAMGRQIALASCLTASPTPRSEKS